MQTQGIEPVVRESAARWQLERNGNRFSGPEGWYAILTHTHNYSGRADHGGTVKPPGSYAQLAAWAAEQGIAAVAVGSPYTPQSAANYGRFDGRERDRYYAKGFDYESVMDADEIEWMLEAMAHYGNGRTRFFLDNETPKGRYGHLWWLGYVADRPAWHDYDQPFDCWMTDAQRVEDFSPEPIPYQRRPYLEILGIQRSAGALGFWAHPTSWWWGKQGQFITNIATEMPVHLIADGFIDGLVVMGYRPLRPQYQALWFELLDRGYRVPGVAEMDVGLSDPKLWCRDDVMVTCACLGDEPLETASMVEAFRHGRLLATSGPFLDLSIDGKHMGEVATTSSDTVHRMTLTAYPKAGHGSLARIELVGRGGQVIWCRDDFAGGTVEVPLIGLDTRGYVLARAYGSDPDRHHWRSETQFAISNPVYLHPRSTTFNPPARTKVSLAIGDDSPFRGGKLSFESMSGEVLETGSAEGRITKWLPANGRVTLRSADGQSVTHYFANANSELQAIQRYLYRGQFIRDFAELQPGEVPPQAWQLDRYVNAMHQLELKL